eukprot:9972127-Lingulodinium_polyedra.AAC.1
MKGAGALPMRKNTDGSMAVGPVEVAEATLRHFGATEAADITDLDTLRKALHDRPRAEESPVPIAC